MNSFLYPVHLIELYTVTSTNDYLKKIRPTNFLSDEWIVVWALEQTKGRGTYGKYWQTEKAKNLTFSFSFATYIPVREKFLLNICISNGIHKRLSLEGRDFFIKWPNDILLRGKKIGGILIENKINKEYIRNTVVGIGLNVHQEKFQTSRVSSLRNLVYKTFNLKELLINIIEHIQKEYQQLSQGNHQILRNYYMLHLFGKREKKYFKLNDIIYEGEIQIVDRDGHLLVFFEKYNQKIYFSPKEIHMIY